MLIYIFFFLSFLLFCSPQTLVRALRYVADTHFCLFLLNDSNEFSLMI